MANLQDHYFQRPLRGVQLCIDNSIIGSGRTRRTTGTDFTTIIDLNWTIPCRSNWPPPGDLCRLCCSYFYVPVCHLVPASTCHAGSAVIPSIISFILSGQRYPKSFSSKIQVCRQANKTELSYPVRHPPISSCSIPSSPPISSRLSYTCPTSSQNIFRCLGSTKYRYRNYAFFSSHKIDFPSYHCPRPETENGTSRRGRQSMVAEFPSVQDIVTDLNPTKRAQLSPSQSQ